MHVTASFGESLPDYSFLIDTSPDLREQLIRNEISRVNSVLYTHDHADQTHGIDDIRVLAYMMRAQLPVYGMKETLAELTHRFNYCFVQPPKSPYPPILKAMPAIVPYTPFELGEEGGRFSVMPLDQDHGSLRSLGFRVGDFAYCNDVVDLPEKSLDQLTGLRLLVIDALRYEPHPTHSHLEKSLSWIEQLRPEKAVLTNLHIDLDYDRLTKETPDHVEPAYDGMTIIL
tara:strand:+ start:3823 stop:4509 length:687 start_codon:yes stop_codon:yes gene_type:complete